MALLTKGTWIVVADEERAIFLENTGDTRDPKLSVIARMEAEPVAERSDRPGRMADNGPGQKSAMEQPDYDRIQGARLAADLVASLTKRLSKGAFDRLVVAAPPQVLGAIRDEMDDALRATILAQISKTLTKHPLPKLAEVVVAEIDPV